jgi:hypothetical protein
VHEHGTVLGTEISRFSFLVSTTLHTTYTQFLAWQDIFERLVTSRTIASNSYLPTAASPGAFHDMLFARPPSSCHQPHAERVSANKKCPTVWLAVHHETLLRLRNNVVTPPVLTTPKRWQMAWRPLTVRNAAVQDDTRRHHCFVTAKRRTFIKRLHCAQPCA